MLLPSLSSPHDATRAFLFSHHSLELSKPIRNQKAVQCCPRKMEHVIGPHGTAKVSEAMAASFVSVFQK